MTDDFTTFKEELKNRVDIAEVIGEYVDLKRRGTATVGLCPFHNEKSPSFNVNREGQFYHCFGCGKGGDVFSFLMDISGMSFMEAVENLAERAGLEMPERRGSSQESRQQAERVAAANLAAAEYFYRTLSAPDGGKGRKYLEDRGLAPETLRAFRLGFAPDDPAGLLAFAKKKGVSLDDLDAAGILLKSKYGGPPFGRFGGRVIFPIIETSGRIIGFGGRILGGEGAKYVNSPETAVYHKSRVLFGLYQAKDTLKHERAAIVVEGYMDVISLHQAGIKNALAASGTSFTTDQGRILSRLARSVTLLFDGDGAGVSAAARSADTLLSTDLAVSVSILPGGHDPDSYIREYGADSLREHISTGMDIWEFKLLALSRGNIGPEDRTRLAGEIADSISLITDELKRESYIKDLSFKIGIDDVAMRKAVMGRIRKRAAAQKGDSPAPEEASGSAQERELLACILRYPDLARRFMEEAGAKPFSHPAVKKAAEAVFHRIVEGLEISPGAIMTALDDGPVKQAVAAAAMTEMDEETAAGYIATNLRLFTERTLRAEIEELGRKIMLEPDPGEKRKLLTRQNTMKTRLGALLAGPAGNQGTGG